jgi:hypothetical protein
VLGELARRLSIQSEKSCLLGWLLRRGDLIACLGAGAGLSSPTACVVSTFEVISGVKEQRVVSSVDAACELWLLVSRGSDDRASSIL